MSPGPTFDRVYAALKQQLAEGRFAPGSHLEPAVLGEELAASITPVRDALHRLVGERLVEAPRNDGFRVPSPTEADLRSLYDWSRMLLEVALRTRQPSRTGSFAEPPLGAGSVGPAASTAALFRGIAARCGNPPHLAEVDNVSDRLAPFRMVEGRLFEDWEEELRLLSAALESGDVAGLRRGIAAYHRRRRRAAPELLAAARLPN